MFKRKILRMVTAFAVAILMVGAVATTTNRAYASSTSLSTSQTPNDYAAQYLNWVDLGGWQGHMFFYFNAKLAGDYSYDAFTDGVLVASADVTSDTVASNIAANKETRFPIFNPGFNLPLFNDNTLAPDKNVRMTFNLYVTIDGRKQFLYTGNEQYLLLRGLVYINA